MLYLSENRYTVYKITPAGVTEHDSFWGTVKRWAESTGLIEPPLVLDYFREDPLSVERRVKRRVLAIFKEVGESGMSPDQLWRVTNLIDEDIEAAMSSLEYSGFIEKA